MHRFLVTDGMARKEKHREVPAAYPGITGQ
jgi:hypothetical protein